MTQEIEVNGQTVQFTVGMYPDGRPGELFIDVHKTGTAVRAWCESTAMLVSVMLQYGVPLSELVDILVGKSTELTVRVPVTGHPVIVDASGVLDAVMRSMALDFLANEGVEKSPDWLSTFLEATEDMGAAEIHDAAEAAGTSEALDNFLGKFA